MREGLETELLKLVILLQLVVLWRQYPLPMTIRCCYRLIATAIHPVYKQYIEFGSYWVRFNVPYNVPLHHQTHSMHMIIIHTMQMMNLHRVAVRIIIKAVVVLQAVPVSIRIVPNPIPLPRPPQPQPLYNHGRFRTMYVSK